MAQIVLFWTGLLLGVSVAPTKLTHSTDHDILRLVATWEADIWPASRFLVHVHPFWIKQVLRDWKTQYIELSYGASIVVQE